MADVKFTAMTSAASVVGTDLLGVTNHPTGAHPFSANATVTQVAQGWGVINVQDASSDPQIDFTNLVAGNEYEFTIIDMIPTSTTGPEFYTRFSIDGGVTYDSTTNYAWQSHVQRDSTSHTVSGSTSDIKGELFNGSLGNNTGESFGANLLIKNQTGSKYTIGYYRCFAYNSAAETEDHMGMILYKDTPVVNAVRFYLALGNITSGKFIMRERKTSS